MDGVFALNFSTLPYILCLFYKSKAFISGEGEPVNLPSEY